MSEDRGGFWSGLAHAILGGGDPEAEGVAAASSAAEPVTAGGLAGILARPPALDLAQASDAAQAELIRQGRYGEAALTGLDNPLLYALGAGPAGRVRAPRAGAAPLSGDV